MARKSKYDAFDDAALIRAARERVLAELAGRQSRQSQAQRVINNIYGSSGVADGLSPGGMGGAGGGLSPDDLDYMVDIERKDLPDINPATGKPAGWSKKVHRYAKKKEM